MSVHTNSTTLLPKTKKKRKNSRSTVKLEKNSQMIEDTQSNPVLPCSFKSVPEAIIQFLNQKQWECVLLHLEPLLDETNVIKNVRLLVFLLWRSECFFEINDHESCAEDCRRIMHLVSDEDTRNIFWFKSRWRLIHSLIHLDAFEEAKPIAQQLAANVCEGFTGYASVKLLKRIEARCLQSDSNTNEEKTALKGSIDNNSDNDRVSSDVKSHKANMNENNFRCVFCNLLFKNESEFENHYLTKKHRRAIISADERMNWKKRPPPSKLSSTTDIVYSLCPHFVDNEVGLCNRDSQCENAHGIEEFNEWRERLEYFKMKLRVEQESRHGKSYAEFFLKRLAETSNQEMIMRESIEGVDFEVVDELTIVDLMEIRDKKWILKLHTTRVLKAVILLHDSHRNNFLLNQITVTSATNKKILIIEKPFENQEWVSIFNNQHNEKLIYEVEVIFHTKYYGTFNQSILFDFGQEPVLEKKLRVDVVFDEDVGKIKKIQEELGMLSEEKWTDSNALILSLITPEKTEGEELSKKFPTSIEQNFSITQSLEDDNANVNNYRSRIRQLLYIEEIAAYYEHLSKYNTPASIRIVNSLPRIYGGKADEISVEGELFATLYYDKNISEDNPAGRLLINNCTSCLLGDSKKVSKNIKKNRQPVMYEVPIEDIGRRAVYLRLHANTVTNLKLKAEDDDTKNKELKIQFQLDRSTFCKWHQAIDSISNLKIIFPNLLQVIKLPNINEKKWTENDSKLNDKQKEAIVAITLSRDEILPPVLIIGPFGTGKTYTLAQAIKHILLEKDSKILICTYSNSAADLFIEAYLHRYVESGIKEATPLRIYHHKHRVPTVSNTVLKYCLIEMQNDSKIFKLPTLKEVLNHRIIITTLNTTSHLSNIGLPAGYFTHILIDEASQALECETIVPLVLANETTRVVLAGDLAQSGPEVFSSFSKQKKFHISLLRRLHESYPTSYPRITLNENYRSHTAIVEFASNIFYNKELINAVEQPRLDDIYPLNFFSIKGQDVQERSSFRNLNEVQELIKRLIELKNTWPRTWGSFNDSIAVLTPYQDQTDCIRLELTKVQLSNITVENISNVQGKQFRVVFLSTVRTGFTCAAEIKNSNDYGFLSNKTLINVALTRAQSLLTVVGDPVSLCIFGRFRHTWKKLIDTCAANNSLHGMTLQEFKGHLWEIELRQTAISNAAPLPFPQATIRTPFGFPFPSFQTPSNSISNPVASIGAPIMQVTYNGINHQLPLAISPAVTPSPLPNSTSKTTAKPTMNLIPNASDNYPGTIPWPPVSQTAMKSTTFFIPQVQYDAKMYPHMPNMPLSSASVFSPATQISQYPSFMTPSSLGSFANGVSQYVQLNSPPNFIAVNGNFAVNPVRDPSDMPTIDNRTHLNDVKTQNHSKNSQSKFVDKMETKEQQHCDELLAKAIISSGSPLTLVDNVYFKNFVQKLRPSYEVLNEKSLRETHLVREFDNMNTHLKKRLINVQNIGMRIDNWSYSRNEGVLNIILTLPEPILYKCIRIPENLNTVEYTMEIVKKVIEEIGSERIFAVIFPNANYFKKAEKILFEEFPCITTIHCLAQCLDSMITFMLECNTIKTIREQCFKIVSAIKKSEILSASLAKIKNKHPMNHKSELTLPSPPLWNTLLENFESIVQSKLVLHTLVETESVETLIEGVESRLHSDEFWNFFNDFISFKSTLLDDTFWDRLNETFVILKPIFKWRLNLEENKCRISDVVGVFDEIRCGLEILENVNAYIHVEEKIALIRYFNGSKKKYLNDIHLAAYFLNPANIVEYDKLDSVMSIEEIPTAFRFIYNTSRYKCFDVRSQKIMKEIAQYRTKTGLWEEHFLWENLDGKDFDPINWWKTFCSHTELSKVAIRILETPITSAATERSFSEISMKRDGLPNENTTKATFIAHNIKLMTHMKSKCNVNL